jgi:hypothetical protein
LTALSSLREPSTQLTPPMFRGLNSQSLTHLLMVKSPRSMLYPYEIIL